MERFVKEASFKDWFRSLIGSSTNTNNLDDLNKVLTKSGLSEEAKAELRDCRNKRVPKIEEMYKLESFEKMKKEPTSAKIKRSGRTITRSSEERENSTRVVDTSKGMER